MSNGYGSYRTTREADMRHYDAAPPLLRRLMQDAVGKWASKPLVETLRATAARKPIGQAYADVIGMIRQSERRHTLTTYGPKHPEVARD